MAAPPEPTPAERPKNGKILVMMPDTLYQRFQLSLKNRLVRHKGQAEFSTLTLPEARRNTFQWVIRFPWHLPEGKLKATDAGKLLYRTPGGVQVPPDRISATDNKQLTALVQHFQELSQAVEKNERRPEFLKLSALDSTHRKILNTVKEFKTLHVRLERDLGEVEVAYHQGLHYLFSTAIERLTGVAMLDNIMRGLVRVMIVDSLDTRTVEGMAKIGYSKKFLSEMSSADLGSKYTEFKNTRAEGEKGTGSVADFIFSSPDFETIDIVLFNNWSYVEDSFLLRLAIRKSAILSRKDERTVKKDPEQIAKQVQEAERELEKARVKLQEAEVKLAALEASEKTDEGPYQAARKARVRVLTNIQRVEDKIKELTKPINAADEGMLLKFDLFETFRSRQSFKDRLGDAAHSFGLGNIWKKAMNPDQRRSFIGLMETARLAKERIQAQASLQKAEAQASRMETQIQPFAEKYGLTMRRPGARPSDPETYHLLLEEHILNCIELAVVSCEIVNQLNKERKAEIKLVD
jgi:hypothetical protein